MEEGNQEGNAKPEGIQEVHSGFMDEQGIQKDDLEISINALTGSVGHSTLRIQGSMRGKLINVLIDSESTHSFVTPRLAKEGIELIHTKPLSITVANGDKLFSTAKCRNLEWMIQGHLFSHDLRVLSIGGSDMVLGVDWMKVYSPLVLDFNEMSVSFQKDGQQVILKGGQCESTLKLISREKLQKLIDKNTNVMGELYMLNVDGEESDIPAEIKTLLDQYFEVFEEPNSLPPVRSHDHCIPLKVGSQPVNLKPYRFLHHQKTEVEKQIQAMLSSSII